MPSSYYVIYFSEDYDDPESVTEFDTDEEALKYYIDKGGVVDSAYMLVRKVEIVLINPDTELDAEVAGSESPDKLTIKRDYEG